MEIGSDVWLGTGVLILSGVKIGHGTIVAARTVVTRDIPPYLIAADVPARVVRKRFSQDQIQRLLKNRMVELARRANSGGSPLLFRNWIGKFPAWIGPP